VILAVVSVGVARTEVMVGAVPSVVVLFTVTVLPDVVKVTLEPDALFTVDDDNEAVSTATGETQFVTLVIEPVPLFVLVGSVAAVLLLDVVVTTASSSPPQPAKKDAPPTSRTELVTILSNFLFI
jgi:hypothetical protein